MRLLFRLQALRAELGITGADAPDVGEQVSERMEALARAAAENRELRLLIRVLDRELARQAAAVPEGRAQGADAAAGGAAARYVPGLPTSAEVLEKEACLEDLAAEIRCVTQDNVDLVLGYEQQIHSLEVELAYLRPPAEEEHSLSRLRGELETLSHECRRLEEEALAAPAISATDPRGGVSAGTGAGAPRRPPRPPAGARRTGARRTAERE